MHASNFCGIIILGDKMDQIEFGKYFTGVRLVEGFNRQIDLANAAGVSGAAISRLEKGKTQASPALLKKVAQCFSLITYEDLMHHAGYLNNSTRSYQFSLFDSPSPLPENEESLAILGDRVKILRKKFDLTQESVADGLEWTIEKYQNVEKGLENLSRESLKILAKYFGVTSNYLLGFEDGIELSQAEIDQAKKIGNNTLAEIDLIFDQMVSETTNLKVSNFSLKKLPVFTQYSLIKKHMTKPLEYCVTAIEEQDNSPYFFMNIENNHLSDFSIIINSKVLIRNQNYFNSGDLVLYQSTSDKIATIRKLTITNQDCIVQGNSNETLKVIPIEMIQVIGKVVRVEINL